MTEDNRTQEEKEADAIIMRLKTTKAERIAKKMLELEEQAIREFAKAMQEEIDNDVIEKIKKLAQDLPPIDNKH